MLFLKLNGLKLFSRLITNYRHRQRRTNDIKALYRMNDRLLADIGISRYQIVEVVDGLNAVSNKEQAQAVQLQHKTDHNWHSETSAACPQT